MNMTMMKELAGIYGWYVTVSQAAKLLGRADWRVGEFLRDANVPFYTIGRSKSFFLPDVIAAIEKTKWGIPTPTYAKPRGRAAL
jgi:hypothetical protein